MTQAQPRRGWAADPVPWRRAVTSSVLGALAGLHPRELARTPTSMVTWVTTAVATVVTVRGPGAFPVLLTVGLWAILLLASLGASCAWERVRLDAASLRVHCHGGSTSLVGRQDPEAAVAGPGRVSPGAAPLAVAVNAGTVLVLLAVAVTMPPLLGRGGPTAVLGVAALTGIVASTLGAWRPALQAGAVDRLVRHNVLPLSHRAVEDAGRISTVVLGTTGVTTSDASSVTGAFPAAGSSSAELLRTALLCCAGDPTPVGQAIARFARDQLAEQGVARVCTSTFELASHGVEQLPRLAGSQGWGAVLPDETLLRTGPAHVLTGWAQCGEEPFGVELEQLTARIVRQGGTPLLVARQGQHERAQVLGVIEVDERVEPGAADLRHRLTGIGVRTVLATCESPERAHTVAAALGINEVVAEVTPSGRERIVREAQGPNRLVAVVGAGAGDARALARADVGLVMHTAAAEALAAGTMIDLACEPGTVVDLVRFGRDRVASQQALSAVSIGSVVAYLLLLGPVVADGLIPRVGVLEALHLSNPQLAVLAAVLLSAVMTVVQSMLAFRGIRSRPGDRIGASRRTLVLAAGGGLVITLLTLTFIDGALTRLTAGAL